MKVMLIGDKAREKSQKAHMITLINMTKLLTYYRLIIDQHKRASFINSIGNYFRGLGHGFDCPLL